MDNHFIEAGAPVLRVVAFAMVMMSFAAIWLNAVTGTGNSRMTFLIELSAIVFYSIYVFVVLEVNQLPLIWAWMSEYLYWTVLFSLSYFYIRSNKWRQVKL